MQTEKVHQEVRDWRDHPITRNFFVGVQDNIEHYENVLAKNKDIFLPIEKRAYYIGLLDGLEALLTYEPEIDDATGEVIIDES